MWDDDIFEEESIDHREPYEKIFVEASGGIDLDGEWKFSGSYKVQVPSRLIDNYYSYSGRVYKSYKSKSRWIVEIGVCGGEYNQIQLKILSKTASSLKQAKKMIVKAIHEFETSNRFKEEVAPKIYHSDHRKLIVKQIDGELFWVASTWDLVSHTVQGNKVWGNFQYPFGTGVFYYRQRKWEWSYPRNENGKKDYDQPEKTYFPPDYRKINLRLESLSTQNADEVKHDINRAIFDVDDPQELMIQQVRYRDLKSI